MSILQALAILEAAMPLGREKQNISTSAISAALSILERQIEPPSLIPQFLCHLRNGAEEVVDKETQQRALRTTFLQIRAAVGQVLRTKRDLLARKFHYTRNPLIKQEIDHLGRELVKLDALWGTSKK